MLTHPFMEQLQKLRLSGMLKALQEQLQNPDYQALTFEERFGLLLDREVTERENRRLQTLLRKAKLHQQGAIEDLDHQTPRGLDRALMTRLCSMQWTRDRLNLLITGPTGTGKSWIACALGNKACRDGLSTRYFRLSRLLQALQLARADGTWSKLLRDLARTDLLVLDDWGLTPIQDEHRRDLLEILDDRFNTRSTLITSQLPVEHWHDYLGDPTLADAILDRLVHNAYRIQLTGESMRKQRAQLSDADLGNSCYGVTEGGTPDEQK
jgi:DNA replication protein DnaC